MRLALAIIELAIIICALGYVAVWILILKTSNSMHNALVKMLIAAMMVVLQIPELIMRILLGEKYAITVVGLVAWILMGFFSAFNLGDVMEKENTNTEDTDINHLRDIGQNKDDIDVEYEIKK